MRKFDFMWNLEIAMKRLREEHGDMANYHANLQHNAGSWNGWPIHRVTVAGVTWYCAACCRNASRDISTIRRVCGRN